MGRVRESPYGYQCSISVKLPFVDKSEKYEVLRSDETIPRYPLQLPSFRTGNRIGAVNLLSVFTT